MRPLPEAPASLRADLPPAPSALDPLARASHLEGAAAPRGLRGRAMGRPVLELAGYGSLLRNLVLRDLKLKYRDSLLGVAWSLLNPLATVAVYTFAFHTVLGVPTRNYPAVLLVSLLPWTFFSTSVLAATGSITGGADLIRRVYFPREALPVATVLFHLAQLLLAFGVFLPLLMLAGLLPLGWASLALAPVLALHALFTIGVALAVSALTVAFRDVAHLSEVGLLLLFWTTPIVYPLEMVPERIQPLLAASPLGAFALAYQDVLVRQRLPGGIAAASLALSTALSLAVGIAIFRRRSARFAEEL